MVTKAQLISELKAKGVRGKLSKMTKPQLQKLHREHSETSKSSSRGNLELEPLPGEKTNEPSIARKRSTYQEFVAEHLKKNASRFLARSGPDHQISWTSGGPPTMAEATVFVNSNAPSLSV